LHHPAPRIKRGLCHALSLLRKWLKVRKGQAPSFDDMRHYQKIIKILCETDRIMKEIELPRLNPDLSPKPG
jgi:hypothetical protein